MVASFKIFLGSIRLKISYEAKYYCKQYTDPNDAFAWLVPKFPMLESPIGKVSRDTPNDSHLVFIAFSSPPAYFKNAARSLYKENSISMHDTFPQKPMEISIKTNLDLLVE